MSQTAIDDEEEPATIWQQLDHWARDFKPWQRYIVGHLVREGKLTESRMDDAHLLFLSEHGLGSGSESDIEVPADISGRPNSAAAASVHISRVSNLACINALPPTAELTFSPTLTVVYGGNGTGKSGFARIFSNACFSRAKQKILPDINARESASEMGADITIGKQNHTDVTIRFDGIEEHPELKRIAVFDTAVARAHLSAPNSFGFKPVGFDVFTEMAKCYGELTKRLDAEATRRKRDNHFPNSFVEPKSNVSASISSLKHDTDLEPIRAYAKFGDTESARLEEVQRQIGDLKAKSIPETIEQLQNAKLSLADLVLNIEAVGRLLSSEKKSLYQDYVTELIYRNRIVAEQGAASFVSEFFKGAGGNHWESFIASGKDLAEQEHEGYPTPVDHCLFCQQPLDDNARALIHRMWEFLASEARNQAHSAFQNLHKAIDELEALKLDFFAETTTCHSHLTRLNPALARRTSDLIVEFQNDYYALTAVMYDVSTLGQTQNVIPSAPWDTETLAVILQAIGDQAEQAESDIVRLRELDPAAALQELENERTELRHRQVLSQLLPDIEEFVADLLWIETAAGAVKKSLNSRPLTAKETELFGKVVADGYRRRLATECGELNCLLPIEFKTEGEKGQTLRSLSMKGGYRPDQILSEGEQRAIALADFLTEINLNNANAGIILDDPVTSQDHRRKIDIARRLVKEAKTRQVIILTHDLVFLTMLSAEALDQSVEILSHWIERDSEGKPGQVSLDDSPATTPQYRDTKKAKLTLIDAEASSGSKRIKLIQRGMAELRRTIEEVVPHHLLKQAVNRWSDRIMVTSLRRVNWDQALVADIVTAFEKLSAYIEGHSHTEQTVGAPPEPADLESCILLVDSLIKRARPERSSTS